MSPFYEEIYHPIMPLILLLGVLTCIGIVLLFPLYHAIEKTGRRHLAFILLLTSLGASVLYGTFGVKWMWIAVHDTYYRKAHAVATLEFNSICGFLFFIFAVPFAAQLYLKWFKGALTDRERLPGAAGMAAWLSPSNLILALVIALTARYGSIDFLPFWPTLIVLLVILAAYPAWKTIQQVPPEAVAQPAPLTDERERVLRLIEEGKITPEDSVELLNALAESARAERLPARPPLGPMQKMKLLGAALLLVGFFLPWLSIDLVKVAQEISRQFPQGGAVLQHQLEFFQGLPGFAGVTAQSAALTPRATLRISGGDLQHGLGWIILLLGVAAAALPWLAPGMDPVISKRVVLVALAAGGFILLYVLLRSLRFASYGIVLTLAGYGLIGLGLIKEFGLHLPAQPLPEKPQTPA